MKKLFLLVTLGCLGLCNLLGYDIPTIFVLQINDSNRSWLAESNIKKGSIISINKISIIEQNGIPEIKKEVLWSLLVDHVAFWKHYAAADVLITAVGDENTDFQKILIFDKSSPGNPKTFIPEAMTAINILGSGKNRGYLYNFICYDAEKKIMTAEKIDLSNMQAHAVDMEEYASAATNCRCKVINDGIVELQGSGLDGARIRQRIPSEFVSEYSLMGTDWYIWENTLSSLILQRNTDNLLELLCMNRRNEWRLYQLPAIGSSDITRCGNNIVVSFIDSSGRNSGLNFIVDVDSENISELLLPPMAKILFFNGEIAIVALLEHIRIIKIIGEKVGGFIDIPYSDAYNAQIAWLDDKDRKNDK